MDVENILVMRGGALGDFILTLPVLAALRRRFPSARLELLANPAFARLALATGLTDEATSLESSRLSCFFSAGAALSIEMAEWFGRFQLIISYLHDPEKIFQTNVRRCTKARFLQGPARPEEFKEWHATDALLLPLQEIGLENPDPVPRLPLPARDTKKHGWAIHPGSGSTRKNWPEEKWGELLMEITAQSTEPILLVGGEAEGDRCARFVRSLPSAKIEVAQDLPLIELAQKMQQCLGFMGHDSGITHLAAALQLPGIILWGETKLERWRPRSKAMQLICADGDLKNLPVPVVLDAWRNFNLMDC